MDFTLDKDPEEYSRSDGNTKGIRGVMIIDTKMMRDSSVLSYPILFPNHLCIDVLMWWTKSLTQLNLHLLPERYLGLR